ncbi:MAG: hypothetical protein AAGU19_11730 [Prolixibacteraceae bacterium]
MVRKSKYAEFIDKFLSGELTAAEKDQYGMELEMDPELREELDLYLQIEDAVQQTDIMDLREQLKRLTESPPGKTCPAGVSPGRQFSFSLREDLSSFTMMSQPVSVHDVKLVEEGLPILHLVQHHIAGRENIHELYRNQEVIPIEDSQLSSSDQTILDDVEDAMEEKDIIDLRASLEQIALNVPAHPYHTEEIERYLNGELDEGETSRFNLALEINSSLLEDVQLHREADAALAEADIMDLRASIKAACASETSTSKKMNEVDRYLQRELTEDELFAFEAEMENNPDLVAEVELHRGIDKALQEKNIMDLRARLDLISKENTSRKNKERSFGSRFTRKRLMTASVAACLILLLGINGIINRINSASADLYGEYYSAYSGSGITRASGTAIDSELTMALLKFNEKNYDEALALFRNGLSKDPKNPVANFYSGMAWQEKGLFSEAIASYELVIQDKNNLFVDQARWYSGLCYLQMDDRKRTVKQFNRLVSNKSYYRERATAILRKIKYIE